MDRKIVKFLTLSIVFAVLASMICSCENVRTRKKTADEMVIEVAEKFSAAMLTADTETIEKIVLDDFEEESCGKILKYYYNNPSWSTSRKKIANEILSTLSYRVDKNSVLASYEREEGTIDVVFTYVDYVKCFEENQYSSESDFDEILADYDKTTYKVITLDLVYEDSDWLIEDFEKAFIDLFSWKEYEFLFVYDFASHLKSMEMNDDYVKYGDTTDYLNLEYFEVGIDVTNSFGDWESCYMVLNYEGNEINRSSLYTWGSSYDYYGFFSSVDYLETGNYEVVLYDYIGNKISSFTFTCENNKNKTSLVKPKSDDIYIYGTSNHLTDVSYAYWFILDDDEFELDIFLYDNWSGDFDCYYTVGYSDTDEMFYTSDEFSSKSTSKILEISGNIDDLNITKTDEEIAFYVYDDDDNLIVKAIMFN